MANYSLDKSSRNNSEQNVCPKATRTDEENTTVPPVPECSPIPEPPFRLLGLPREIRDMIYDYALTLHDVSTGRPLGIKFPLPTPNPLSKASPVDTSLLLTSHQLATEASRALLIHNTLRLHNYFEHNRVEDTIRLIPSSHARNIRNINITYLYKARKLQPGRQCAAAYDKPPTHLPAHWPAPDLSGLWAVICSDAQLLKTYFPLLRGFTARVAVVSESFEYESDEQLAQHCSRGRKPPPCKCPDLRHADSGHSVSSQLDWLTDCYAVHGASPPEWLEVEWLVGQGLNREAWREAFPKFKEALKKKERSEMVRERGEGLVERWVVKLKAVPKARKLAKKERRRGRMAKTRAETSPSLDLVSS